MFGENSNEVLHTRNAWNAVGLFETNPIKWKIASESNWNINESMIGMQFDLVIDSIGEFLSADKLYIKLQPPNEINIDDITALPPLTQ